MRGGISGGRDRPAAGIGDTLLTRTPGVLTSSAMASKGDARTESVPGIWNSDRLSPRCFALVRRRAREHACDSGSLAHSSLASSSAIFVSRSSI